MSFARCMSRSVIAAPHAEEKVTSRTRGSATWSDNPRQDENNGRFSCPSAAACHPWLGRFVGFERARAVKAWRKTANAYRTFHRDALPLSFWKCERVLFYKDGTRTSYLDSDDVPPCKRCVAPLPAQPRGTTPRQDTAKPSYEKHAVRCRYDDSVTCGALSMSQACMLGTCLRTVFVSHEDNPQTMSANCL